MKPSRAFAKPGTYSAPRIASHKPEQVQLSGNRSRIAND